MSFDHAEHERMLHAEESERRRRESVKGHEDSAARLANPNGH